MQHHIVIGANYGDEGKGLMTDYLVRKHGIKTVVRFNGGAQAGHTVVADSKRTVFSSFGSGTLAGAKTRLTTDVILNPFAALQEAYDHPSIRPIEIYTTDDAKSPITTPVDIRLNQLAEELRGTNRHGSCGLGINETVTRHKAIVSQAPKEIDPAILDPISWEWMVRNYLFDRMTQLKLTAEMQNKLLADLPDMYTSYVKTWKLARKTIYTPRTYEEEMEEMVFEGAQGLALDEINGVFPHVTRSRTGVTNALNEIGREIYMRPASQDPLTINIYYMTRAYLTRHGAGPLYCEMDAKDLSIGVPFGTGRFVDETNHPNDWQGTLRFAPLDVGAVCARIQQDLRDAAGTFFWLGNPTVNASVVITCTDQFPKARVVNEDRGSKQLAKMNQLPALFSHYGVKVSHVSTGPSAADIIEL